jgi:hypothetical protein
MRNLIIALLLLAGLPFLTACSKDGDRPPDCQQLKDGVISLNKEEVKLEITAFINSLPAKTHTQLNLQRLVDAINSRCGNTASVLCYACIDTLPEQSEIRLSYSSGGGIVHQIIEDDLS